MIGMSAAYLRDPRGESSYEDANRITCGCDDTEAHAVAALVTAGMGMREACITVYSGRYARTAEIHARFHAWFPWLRGCCEVTS
jgi:hypothetical protein